MRRAEVTGAGNSGHGKAPAANLGWAEARSMTSRGTSRAAHARWALRALWPVLLARGGRAAALEAEVSRLAWPQTKRPFCIGVAGATASGKTTVVNEIVRLLDHEHVASITQAVDSTSCPLSFMKPTAALTA